MAENAIALGQSVQGNPGDTFKFLSTSAGTSYRFAVSPPSGKGTFVFTVDRESLPYQVALSKTPGFFNWISGLFG